MNVGEIAERLVQAAEISRNISVPIGPAQARSLPLPYAHDWADRNGWGKERLEEEEREFIASVSKRPTPQQVSEAEEALRWYGLVSKESNRFALSVWVSAMAGGRLFKDACFKAGFHPETGRRRKDRALLEIERRLARKPLENNETGGFEVLPDTPDFEDIEAILNTAAVADGVPRFWRADDAQVKVLGAEDRDFSWADKRNEMRRQREERKRKLAEKEAKRQDKRAA